MSKYVYYYGEEAMVFADLSDARDYFIDTDIIRRYDDDFAFRSFLDENYTLADLFKMKAEFWKEWELDLEKYSKYFE